MRLKFLDQSGQKGVDFAKALRKMFGAFASGYGGQGAKAKHAATAAVTFNHTVSGCTRRGGIDAEHAKELTIGSRGERHGNECTAGRCVRRHFFRCFVAQASASGVWPLQVRTPAG